MATKDDLVEDYLQRLNLSVTNWDAYVVEPFAMAYDTAFNSYKSTIDSQAKADQAKIELLFIGLSLLGGSMVTAMIGKAAVSALAKELAVATICNLNMKRTFNLAAMLEKSPAASFAIGGLVDEASKYLTGKVKDAVTSGVPKDKMITLGNTPLSVYLSMKNVVSVASSKAQTAALDIKDNRNINADEAKKALDIMKRAAIMRAPKKEIYGTGLANALELTMYLNLVMTRDHVVVKQFDPYSERGPKIVSRTSIGQAPGASNYPTSKYHAKSNQMELIEVEDLGRTINARMNRLHRAFFGKDLVDNRLFADKLTSADLKEAHWALQRLSTKVEQPELKALAA